MERHPCNPLLCKVIKVRLQIKVLFERGTPSPLKVACYYRPQRSCGQGNIFTLVCHSVHRGVSASVHAGIPHPPGADTPWEQTPPGAVTPTGADTPLAADTPRQQTPPWQQTPPRSRHPPRADNPPEQTPPPPRSRHLRSRLRHTVNERAVRILLECILVFSKHFNTIKELRHGRKGERAYISGKMSGIDCILSFQIYS